MLVSDTILQNRYRVIDPLGEGGMSAVYYAWDTRLDIPVALKEMTPQVDWDADALAKLRQQFQQEATTLARLEHPHLVGVTDFFEENARAYLVMKFVEGESLDSYIQRVGRLTEQQVLMWSAQLLDAISYCHSHGVIHRDIKPQNIIIRPDGEAVLVDFGLVKLWNPDDPRTKTVVRGMGSPQYAPPEQYGDAVGHTGPQSDLYSLGATIYHALAGVAPASATLRVAVPSEFKPIKSVRPEISDQTAQAIEKALALSRADRWPTAAAMAQALGVKIKNWAPATGQNHPRDKKRHAPTKLLPSSTPAKKRRPIWRWGLISLGALALIGVVSMFFGQELLSQLVDVLNDGKVAALLLTNSPTVETSSLPPTDSVTLTLPPTEVLTPGLTDTVPANHTPSSMLTNISTSTAEPTSTPVEKTVTPSPTPSATPTLVPTPTPKQASVTPSATPTQRPATPSVTPTQRPPTPTATPKPVATGAPNAKALINFETWGGWRRGDQPYGELIQTQEQFKSGAYAAKLQYDFPAVSDDYVVFIHPQGIGYANTIGVWVYGDGSGHYINAWIQDAAGEMWSIHLGKVGGSGWQQLAGSLDPTRPWPSGHISGPDNQIIDYPVSFYALVLDRPDVGPQKGYIYVDDISAWQSSTPTEASATPTQRPATPSVTPTQRPPAATATPKPAATVPANPKVLINFETWGGWRRGDQPYGELIQTQEQFKSGAYAAKLQYDFPAVSDDYVVFIHPQGIGYANTIGVWVYGDGSGHYINAWIQDAAGEMWSIHLGKVGGSGWQQLAGSLDPTRPWPSGHISGPDNQIIDYPVSFYALVLDRPDVGPQKGYIYVDDISAW